jgi:predicted dehydrogenase
VSAPIALGIVGFGIMGERLLRAALGHAADSVTPVGVWDPAPDARARLAAVSAAVPLLPSTDAVVAACDCLYVAAPPAAHIPLAEAALAAGRAVFWRSRWRPTWPPPAPSSPAPRPKAPARR